MLSEFIFSGFGGQGVLMMGYVLSVACMNEEKHVTFLPSYGAEMRGGTANCTVVVSDKEIASPIASRPEFAVAMNHPSMVKYQDLVKAGGCLFLNSDLILDTPEKDTIRVVRVPANSLAHEMGQDRALNMVMLGVVAAISGIVSEQTLFQAVETVLGGKKRSLIEINQQALVKGREYAAGLHGAT